MKKPIAIGVIAVIVAVGSVLAVGVLQTTVDAEKPLSAIKLELKTGFNSGTIICPNGDEIDTNIGDLRYTEHIGEFIGGSFSMTHTTFNHPPPPERFESSLSNGNVDSDKFRLFGVGIADAGLIDFCNEAESEKTKIVVWGNCGEDVLVRFESDLGYSGSFTATAFCI